MGLKYECTALVSMNKTGKLEQDKDGYYHVTFAAFDFPNAAGIPYDYEMSKHVFEPNSTFMRKLLGAKLYSEVEHPEPPIPDPRHPDFEAVWIGRSRQILMGNACGHIRQVRCDPGTHPETGAPIWVCHGWIKPAGEKAHVLKELLDNPHINVCFSLRSIIDEVFRNGRKVRVITELITFDLVSEGGISIATKYDSPGMESYAVATTRSEVSRDISMDCLVQLRDKEAAKQRMGVESNVESVETLINAARRSNNTTVTDSPLFSWV